MKISCCKKIKTRKKLTLCKNKQTTPQINNLPQLMSSLEVGGIMKTEIFHFLDIVGVKTLRLSSKLVLVQCHVCGSCVPQLIHFGHGKMSVQSYTSRAG